MGLFKSKADRLFEKAKDEFKFRSGSDASFAEIERAAEMGSDSAKGFLMEFYCGTLPRYHNGAKGAEVCEYMIRKHDVPLAKFYLGRLYYFGDGVPQDFEKARRLFSEAAGAKKYSAPQGNGYIGAMYFWGDGVPQSYEEAAKYLGNQYTISFCDYQWDVLYCCHYMHFYGLGGFPRRETDGWKGLVEISERKDLSPRTREHCLNLVCLHTLERLEKLVKEEHLDTSAINVCLSTLKPISEGGVFLASCALADYYLSHYRKHTHTLTDRKTGEVEVISETTSDYDEEATIYLKKVRSQLKNAPKGEKEEHYAFQLLFHASKIDQLVPGLVQELRGYLPVVE